MNSYKYRGHRIGNGFGAIGPIIGRVWNANKVTFDGRDYWLGSIDRGNHIITVAGDEVDGTMQSAINFVVAEAASRLLGPIDILVKEVEK